MSRPKGEDRGLFERPPGSGVWWIRYHDEKGLERREKVGPKAQAQRLYQLRQGQKLEGKLPSVLRPRLTLEQLTERYAEEAKAFKKSWEGDLVHARAWVAVLGHEDIRDIRPGDIEAAKGRWLSSLAPATVNRRLAYLKTLFGRAVRDGLIDTSPLGSKRVKMLREAPPRDRIISPEEERALLDHLSPMMSRALYVALYTGLRQAEQMQMTRKDVQLPRLRILDAKGGGRQWVEVSPQVAAVLREQLASHKSTWVWPNDGYGEGHLSGDTAYERLTAAARALGLAEGILWHSARHTFVSRLCMLGTPLPTVQRLSRHKSLAMLLRYAHLCPDHASQALLDLHKFSTNTPESRPAPKPALGPAPSMQSWPLRRFPPVTGGL